MKCRVYYVQNLKTNIRTKELYMQYGVTFPNVDARTLAELAHEAEEAGWDGVFVWDIIWGIDAWVS